jgi:hypothetical protein
LEEQDELAANALINGQDPVAVVGGGQRRQARWRRRHFI